MGREVANAGPLLALALAGPTGTAAEAIVATADRICLPALTGEARWPTDLADEAALLATAGLTPGIPKELSEKLATLDPRLDSLSRAILASHTDEEAAFGLALGGVERSCRVLVYRSVDPTALAAALDKSLVAQGWTHVAAPPTRYPKHAFLRRTATGRVAIVHLILPVQGSPIAPTLVVEVMPAGTPIPPEYGL